MADNGYVGTGEPGCSKTQHRAKKRKQYLEPGQPCVVPRTTLRYRKQKTQSSGLSYAASEQQPTTEAAAHQGFSPQDGTEGHGDGVSVHESSDTFSAGGDSDAYGDPLPYDQDKASTYDQDEAPTDDEYDSDCENQDDSDAEEFCDLFPNMRLPNADLTVRDAMFVLMAYTKSSGLNWADMEKLVTVINLFLGKPVLPTSQYMLRKVWRRWNKEVVTKHYYCEQCEVIVPNPNQREFTCPHCNTVNSSSNIFASLSLKKQIEVLLSDDGVAKALRASLDSRAALSGSNQSDNDAVTDIGDGRLYKRQMQEASWSDISLTFNTDGAKVFKSCKSSMWPIQAVVNELPVRLRWSNVLLCGLYFGKGHPKMGPFLDTFIDSVEEVGTVEWDCDGQKVESRVRVICCCVDAPARAAVLNMKQYNGYHGCSYCHHPGVPVNRTIKYPVGVEGENSPRTSRTVRNDMRASLLSGVVSRGIKGFSPVARIREFDMVWGVCPDYMHCVLQGVARQLTELWLGDGNSLGFTKESEKFKEVNRRLLSIKPPQWFTRLPRSLDERAQWKASEWKWWLLFYAAPCLEGILPEEHHNHFTLLVGGVYLLLKDSISKADIIMAVANISTFVHKIKDFYGEPAMTFNVHQLLHLPKSVVELGPLWSHSAFVFESGNGMLLKLVSDANGVALQVLERFVMQLQLKKLSNTLQLPSQVEAVYQRLTSSVPAHQKMETRLLGTGIITEKLDGSEERACLAKLGYAPSKVTKFQRISTRGQLLHTSTYKRPVKTNNCIFKCTSGRYYVLQAIYKLLDGTCVLLGSNLACKVYHDMPHMRLCAKSSDITALSPSEVDRVCVSIEIGSASYVADLPNMYEKD